MNNQDYHGSIVANVTPKEALDKISRVSEWWAANFEGKSKNVNDVFTVRFKGGDMYKLEVIELVPDKKIGWQVIDSNQAWVANVSEWTGTRILWEVSAQQEGTRIEMTHMGLTPQLECYGTCERGWEYLLHKSLFGFLTGNKGLPA